MPLKRTLTLHISACKHSIHPVVKTGVLCTYVLFIITINCYYWSHWWW